MYIRHKFISILFLAVVNYGYCQEKANSGKNATNRDINNIEIALNDSIKNLTSQFQKRSTDFKTNELQLKRDISDASKTIEYLNSLVNSFGQIFTILGIFIAIITLILPVLTYQFGVKPYKKALQELEKGMDQRLENYLKDARNNEIDKALRNIKEGNSELKNQAISYLTLTQHEGFSDSQLFQIYSILNKHRDENNIKSQLAFILSTRRNDYANELFNSPDVAEDQVIRQMAYLYYAKIGFEDNYDGILTILESSDSQNIEFRTLAFNLMQFSNGQVINLFNDKKIIDVLNDESLKELKKDISTLIESLNTTEEEYKESYLAEKLRIA